MNTLRWKLGLLIIATLIFLGIVLANDPTVTGMVSQSAADTLSSIDQLLSHMSNGAYTPQTPVVTTPAARRRPAEPAPAADLQIIDETTTSEMTIKTLRAPVIVGERVKWIKNVSLTTAGDITLEVPLSANITRIASRKGGVESVLNPRAREALGLAAVDLDDGASGYSLEYETDAPQATEETTSYGVRVSITAPDELNYTDVVSFSAIPERVRVGKESSITIRWVETGDLMPFNATDTDGNGLIDRVQWITPHLSNQTFDIIVITGAQHLDENRTFIEDVYESVRERDGNWTAEIPAGHYIRVTFERNLTAENDITMYSRSAYPSAGVEVYEAGGATPIADFGEVGGDGRYAVLLTSLVGEQDTFDLKITGNPVEFDFIVDPTFTTEFFEDCNSIAEWASTGSWVSTGSQCDVNNGGGVERNLTSPAINLTGRTHVNLTFDITTAALDGGEYFRVYLSNNNISYTTLFTQSTNGFTQQTFALEDFVTLNGTVYIRGACLNNQGSEHCYWDNITVTSASTDCGSVTRHLNFANNINTSGTCLNIDADNLIINCRGFAITGGQNGIGINMTGRSNITVRDCTLTNFTTAIQFASTTGSMLRNITIYNSTRGILNNASPTNFLWNISFVNNTVSLHVQDGRNITINETFLPNISIFQNSTFGSINFTNTTNLTGRTNLLNVTSMGNNSIFINITNTTGLNRSAVLSFRSLGANTFINPQAIVDLNDDNNYVVCTAGIGCNTIHSDVGTGVFIFSVTHFTTYKVNESPANTAACQTLGGSVTLSANVNTSGTCFQVASPNIFLNCAGYNVTGGLGGGAGINITDNANITVRDCRFLNFTAGALLRNAQNVTLRNSTFLNNTLGVMHNTSAYQTFLRLSFINNSVSLHVQNGTNLTINETLLPSISIIENLTFAAINFTNTTNLTPATRLIDVLGFSNTSVFINSTAAPGFNRSAVLTLRSIGADRFRNPQAIADFSDAGNFAVCTAALGCNEIFTDTAAGVFIYNVSRFTTYRANETGVAAITALLNMTSEFNSTEDNITLNLNTTDPNLKNITVWSRNGLSVQILNMPFEVSAHPLNATDYAGFDNNATSLTGSAAFNKTGGFDGRGAYQFNPAVASSAVNLAATNFPAIGTGNYTVEARIKLNDSRQWNTIFSIGTFSPAFYVNLGDRLTVWDGGAVNSTTGLSVADNQWHHVAFVREGTGAGQMKFYLDGVPVGTATSAGSIAAPGALYVGWDNSGTDIFNGTIDEVRVWSIALSADQVRRLSSNDTSVIVKNQSAAGDIWFANVTPNNGAAEAATVTSNNVTVREACRSVSETSTLGADITSADSCIRIAADNLVFSCAGFSIRGAGLGIGINVTGRSNVTVRDCLVSNFSTGLSLTGATNSSVLNSTFANATRGLLINASANNTLRMLGFVNDLVSLHIQDDGNVSINETLLPNISIIEITAFGSINFTNTTNLTAAVNLINVISITNNTIFVNSTAAPGLNRSAVLTLRGIGNASDPVAYADFNDSGNFITCTPALGCNNISFNAVTQTFVYNVSRFTTYSSVQPTFVSWVFNATQYPQGRSPPTNFTSPVPFNVRYGRTGDGGPVVNGTCIVSNNETAQTATLVYNFTTGNYTTAEGDFPTYLLYDNTTFTVNCSKPRFSTVSNTSTAIIPLQVYIWDFVNLTFGNESQINTSVFLRKEIPTALDASRHSATLFLGPNATVSGPVYIISGSNTNPVRSFLKSFHFLGNETIHLNISVNESDCYPRLCAGLFDGALNSFGTLCGPNMSIPINTPVILNTTFAVNFTISSGTYPYIQVECVHNDTIDSHVVNLTVYTNYSGQPVSGEIRHAQPTELVVNTAQNLIQLESSFLIGPDQNVSSRRQVLLVINNSGVLSASDNLYYGLPVKTIAFPNSILPNATVVINSTGQVWASDNASISPPKVLTLNNELAVINWQMETVPPVTVVNETVNVTYRAALRTTETVLANQTGYFAWHVNITSIFSTRRAFANVTVFTNLTLLDVPLDWALDVNLTNSSGIFNITSQVSFNATTGILSFPQVAVLDDPDQLYVISARDLSFPNITVKGCVPLAGSQGDVVLCNATVIDATLRNVSANVTRPDGVILLANVSNTTGAAFFFNFTGSQTGRYNVTWFANDSTSLVATKDDSFFIFIIGSNCLVNNATSIFGNSICINSTLYNTTTSQSNDTNCVASFSTQVNSSCTFGNQTNSFLQNTSALACDITLASVNDTVCVTSIKRNGTAVGCRYQDNAENGISVCVQSIAEGSSLTNVTHTNCLTNLSTMVNVSCAGSNNTFSILRNSTVSSCDIWGSVHNGSVCAASSLMNMTAGGCTSSGSELVNGSCLNGSRLNTTAINLSGVRCFTNFSTVVNSLCVGSNLSFGIFGDSNSTNCDVTGTMDNSSVCVASVLRNVTMSGCESFGSVVINNTCTDGQRLNSTVINSVGNDCSINFSTTNNVSCLGTNLTQTSAFNTSVEDCDLALSSVNHSACTDTALRNVSVLASAILVGAYANSTLNLSFVSGGTIANSTIHNASLANTTLATTIVRNSTFMNVTAVQSTLNNSNLTNAILVNVTANNVVMINCSLSNNASIDNTLVQNCVPDLILTALGCKPVATNLSAVTFCNLSITTGGAVSNASANVTRPDGSVFNVNISNFTGTTFFFNATSSISGSYNVTWRVNLSSGAVGTATDRFLLLTQSLNCTADANTLASGAVNCTNSIIANSTIINSNITACNVNGTNATNSTCISSNATFSTLFRTFVDPSQLDNCNAPDSTILDSVCFNSTKINSSLANSTANLSFNNRSVLINSTEQNSSMFNASIVNSIMQRTRIINSTIFNNSFSNRSFINNSRINASNILNSTLNNATVINSNVTRCTLTNNNTLVNVAVDCSPVTTGKINRVLSGFLNFTNTSIKLPLGVDINASASFLVMTVRENQSRPTDGHVLGFIHNSTHIGFERPNTAAGNILIQWYVAEWREGVTVYRGISTVGTSENELAISIGGTVNTEQAFIIPAGFNNTGNGFNDKDYAISRVFNSTHIGASFKGVGGSGGQLSWQVVDFGGAFVQRGQVGFDNAIVNITLPSPVDRSRSIAVTTYLVGASSSSVGAIATRFTNDSGIEFSRNASSAQGNISWQVIELPPEQLILHNLTTFRPEEYMQNVTIPEVDLNRSIAFSTTSPFGGMSNGRQVGFSQAVVGHSMFTHNVTSPTNLQLLRETNGTEAAVGWHVWVLGPINCGPVDHSINFNSNVTVSNGTCFPIAANNIVVNCRGFTLTGPGSGVGIEIENFDNVTIRDCVIRNFTHAIETELSALTTIRNVTFINNTEGIFDSRSTSVTFINNSFINNTISLRMRNTLDATLTSTQFPPIMLWENTTAASVNFTEAVNVTNPVQLSDIAALTNNRVFLSVVDSPEFNRSAVLSFRGITFEDPQPIVDFNDTADFLACNSTLGCSEISFLGGTFIYNVSHFTTYSSNESPDFNLTLSGAAPCTPCALNVSQNMTCNISIINSPVFGNISANVTAPNGSIFPQVIFGGGNPFFVFNRTDIGGIYNITWVANDTFGNVVILRTNCTVQTAPVFANRFENPPSPAIYDAALESDLKVDWLIFEAADDVVLSIIGPTTIGNVSARFNQFESVTPVGFLVRYSQSFHGLLPGVYNGTWVANDTFGRKNFTNFTYVVRTPAYPPTVLLSAAGAEDGDDVLSIDAVLTLPERVTAFNNATLSLYRMNGTSSIFLLNSSNYTLVQPGHFVFQFNRSDYTPGSYVAVVFVTINESAPNVHRTSVAFIIPDRTSVKASGTLFLTNDTIFVDALYFLGSTPSDDANCSISVMDDRLNTVLSNASMALRNISAVPHYQFLETNWSNRTGVNNETGKFVGHVRCVRNSAPGTITFTTVDFEVRDIAKQQSVLSAIEGNATRVIAAISAELNATRAILQSLLERQEEFSAEEIFLITDSLVQVDRIAKAIGEGSVNPDLAKEQLKIIEETIAPLISGRAVDAAPAAATVRSGRSSDAIFYLIIILSIVVTAALIIRARMQDAEQFWPSLRGPPRMPPRQEREFGVRSAPPPRAPASVPRSLRSESIPNLPPPAPVMQLKSFIRDARRKGWRRDAIVAMLRSRGWPEALVEHYYIEVIEEERA